MTESEAKRDRYMHAYGGKVSSPTGRKTIMGHSHVPSFPPGMKHYGTQTGRISCKLPNKSNVPQYNTGPSAWNHPGPIILTADVHAVSVWHDNLTADEILAIYNRGGAANIGDFEKAELRIAQAMFGGEMCGDCIRVALCKEHDPMTADRKVCPLCETVWQGAEPGNRRREAVESTRRRRGSK